MSLRIIAGEARGRKLKGPPGLGLRPTSNRVREALFNIISPVVEDSVFLDLFSGTGSIGIEALSRGAKEVYFIEIDPQNLQLIRENLNIAGFSSRAHVYGGNAHHLLMRLKKTFNLIYVDPPYRKGESALALKEIAGLGLLDVLGQVIVESAKNEEMQKNILHLQLSRQERYGDTMLSFYKYSQLPPADARDI